MVPITSEAIGEEHPWFAVRVKSNREKVTAMALRGYGYEELVPMYRPQHRPTGRTKAVELPLFPGYVFCRFNIRKRLPILMLPGVLHIVGNGKEPVPLDSAEVASIRILANSPLRPEPFPFLEVGRRVSVISGPLVGAQGLILSVGKKYRLVASLTILGRSIAVEIDREWVQPFDHVHAGNPSHNSVLLR
jgi:transcription antitermination factor NusG